MLNLNFLLSVLAVVGPTEALRYIGRVNPATKELTWSGTGVEFTFEGSSASIGIRTSGTNSADLIIDGTSTYIPNVNGNVISTPTNLTRGKHTITFRKSSEALFGSIFIGNITTNGAIKPDPPVSKRRIEIIGDSITSAYGIGAALPCTNTAALEIISEGYSILTAKALKAEVNIISWSGIGIIRNYAGETPGASPIMPERYTRYGANDADGSYTFPKSDKPDVVVINLGTNDFGHNNVRPRLNGTDYTAAVVKFVRYVKSSYHTNASFFLLSSPMMSDSYPAGEAVKTTQVNALKDAVMQLNETKAYFVDWPAQGSEVGCDYHPTPATNAIGTKLLTEAIRTAMGW